MQFDPGVDVVAHGLADLSGLETDGMHRLTDRDTVEVSDLLQFARLDTPGDSSGTPEVWRESCSLPPCTETPLRPCAAAGDDARGGYATPRERRSHQARRRSGHPESESRCVSQRQPPHRLARLPAVPRRCPRRRVEPRDRRPQTRPRPRPVPQPTPANRPCAKHLFLHGPRVARDRADTARRGWRLPQRPLGRNLLGPNTLSPGSRLRARC